MNLKTKRRYNCPKYCIGTMFVGILRFSDTLEDTDRGLTQDMLLSEITKLKTFSIDRDDIIKYLN